MAVVAPAVIGPIVVRVAVVFPFQVVVVVFFVAVIVPLRTTRVKDPTFYW